MDTNVYEGKTITGKVVTTISQGNVVWNHGKLNIKRGAGRFIPLEPFGSLYHGVHQRNNHNAESFSKQHASKVHDTSEL